MPDFQALLAEFTAAVEAGDGARLAALFCADGVYNDVFYGAFRGRDAIAEMIDKHFWGHARDFVWEMKAPVCDGQTGYAHYVFSYTSTLDEAAGRRVVFEGYARFDLADDGIKEYSEVFDAGLALAQLGFPPPRLARHLDKAAARLRGKYRGTRHITG
jgi:ketosteroid isomerase-like protein